MTKTDVLYKLIGDAAFLEFNKHLNNRYSLPGQYIMSLDEETRKILKTLKSEDFENLRNSYTYYGK